MTMSSVKSTAVDFSHPSLEQVTFLRNLPSVAFFFNHVSLKCTLTILGFVRNTLALSSSSQQEKRYLLTLSPGRSVVFLNDSYSLTKNWPTGSFIMSLATFRSNIEGGFAFLTHTRTAGCTVWL